MPPDLLVGFAGKEAETVAAALLGLVHGNVGILEQVFGIAGVQGVDGDTDAG